MSKKSTPEEKVAENQKNAKAADKKRAKNKVNAAAKKMAEKAVLEIAASMPAGEGNAFIQLFNKYFKAVEQCRAAATNKGNVRKELKAIKVDMKCFDRVFRLYEMDAADVAATKATEALYEKQLGMKLSPEQEKIVADIETKRENAKAAMSELNGGETGKEVGSGMIGHNSEGSEDEEGEAQDVKKPEPLPSLPERNESIGKGFRVPDKAASQAIN